jgi:murein DD-endopeptidase MepM/ murein hydrolase activator NlpD
MTRAHRLVLAMLPVLGFMLCASRAVASMSPIVDPGPFTRERIVLSDGRTVDVPPETVALYRMLTQNGRLNGRHTARPSEAVVQASIELRRQHEPAWTIRFGDRRHTPESAYLAPLDRGWLSVRPGYRPGHRAEDIFAPVGARVLAPATMLVLHAGYLSKTAGEAVVGFIPGVPGHTRARYLTFVHIDVSPARGRVGDVVEPGTLLGHVASTDEAVVGSSVGRLPHVHFSIAEERPDGQLEGIWVYDLLRRAIGAKTHVSRDRRHVS